MKIIKDIKPTPNENTCKRIGKIARAIYKALSEHEGGMTVAQMSDVITDYDANQIAKQCNQMVKQNRLVIVSKENTGAGRPSHVYDVADGKAAPANPPKAKPKKKPTPTATDTSSISEDDGRDTFVFLKSYYESVSELPDKERLEWLEAVIRYSLYFEEPTFTTPLMKAVWKATLPVLFKNWQKYLAGKGLTANSPQEAKHELSRVKHEQSTNKAGQSTIGDTPYKEGEGDKEGDKEKEGESVNAPAPSKSFLSYCKWFTGNFHYIASMEQMTEAQYKEIRSLASLDDIKGKLQRMENAPNFAAKHRSIYATLKSFIQEDRQKGGNR